MIQTITTLMKLSYFMIHYSSLDKSIKKGINKMISVASCIII